MERPQQQRTMTLGPSAPIHDWEVEKVTLLNDLEEYRDRAESLERKIQADRATYERNTASLLREVKMKESLLEKRAQDIERQLMGQIQDMQRQNENQRTEHEDEIQELRARHDHALATEQKKHERRLASMQERIENVSEQRGYRDQIETLRSELTRERSQRAQDKLEWQTRQQQMASQTASQRDLSEKHNVEMQRMRELFMNECYQQSMQHEARIQNLRSEYEEALREARDQLETEQDVWAIERQAQVDQATRVAQQEKEEAIKKLSEEWRDKMLDVQTSMSKDASAIQQYWQGKLDEAEATKKAEIERLKGEMEVVKHRLGKEIDRRKQMQAKWATAVENERHSKVYQQQLEQQLDTLGKELNEVNKSF
ncbi:hypothetical protein BDB00DRAFT_761015 [Zychaea mexicana]|uniref:uncharacterized protein n=1 Tax=Zychaea mexicana TaxID=64656 RepID=UPI0022FF234E|nr:uncharacterized protein BDB00DRAFT_761015 [Zychaea mexicana]KAI9494891.1 hypothetical protein BDB00DRAFT_761015 [Zychaea mexicana]